MEVFVLIGLIAVLGAIRHEVRTRLARRRAARLGELTA